MEPEAVITPARIHEFMAAIRPNAPPVDRLPKEGCVEGAIGNAVIAARYA